jgi:hypothetical protein
VSTWDFGGVAGAELRSLEDVLGLNRLSGVLRLVLVGDE